MADDNYNSGNGSNDENNENLNGGPNGENPDEFADGAESEFDDENSEGSSRPASDKPLRPIINANGQMILPDGSRLVQMPIQDELKGSYLTYAMSVIVSRAIPDVRDGLKPSQRRILVAMNDLGIGPHSQRVKCAKISGDASGNYHPHGEAIIYPTLVRMAQEWNMRHVLVDKQGNFGSIAGLPPAAMRYTEARLSGMAMAMLEDLNLDTVDFIPTYDGTRLEPNVLPAKVPNLLVNGANGIAVGMMTSIPPHNLGEICDAAVAVIDDPDVSPFDLLRLCPGPDFPTGGIICGANGIRRAYLTGRGNVVVRARIRVEEIKGKGGKAVRHQIVVSEIPYQQARDRIEEKIAEMVNEGRIVGVAEIRNESDLKEPVRLVLRLKQGTEPSVVVNQLYQFTPLEDTFSIILLALVEGKPRVMTFKELIVEFLRHRKSVIRRRTTFLLNKAIKRQHTVEGLLIAHANIDEVIRVIRTSPNQYEAKQRLMQIQCPSALLERCLGAGFESFQQTRGVKESYTLTPVQADAILKMTLGQLVNLEQQKLADEYNSLLDDIAEYRRILSDERNILAIVRDDLLEVKAKYADKRRTEINQDELAETLTEDLIPEETMVVTITNDGFIKRTPLFEYKAQSRSAQGNRGAKTEADVSVCDMYVASTHDNLLFFTNKGRVFSRKVFTIQSASRVAKGMPLAKLLDERLTTGEAVVNCLPVRHFDQENAYLFMATREGVVKKTALSAFGRINKSGLIGIKLRGEVDPDALAKLENEAKDSSLDSQTQEQRLKEFEALLNSKDRDSLVSVAVCYDGDEIFLSTALGRTIRFRQSDVRSMGRTASGVRGIRLRKGDYVVGMAVANEDAYLLSVCENGFGKRTKMGPNAAPILGDETDAELENDDEAVETNVEANVEANVESDAELAEGTENEDSASNTTYRTMRRGGQGVLDIKTTARNGVVAAVVRVLDGDDVMLVTANGKIKRLSVDSIRATGRNTQGVTVMKFEKGKTDSIVAVKAVPPEREIEETKEIVGVQVGPEPKNNPQDDESEDPEFVSEEEQIERQNEEDNE